MQTTDLAHSLVLTGRILEFIKKKMDLSKVMHFTNA